MKINYKTILLGLLISIFIKDVISKVSYNYQVEKFFGRSGLSINVFYPIKYQDWPLTDVRASLLQEMDESGAYSCLHVIPVEPAYQITTTLSDGTKACCSIQESLNIPFKRTTDGVEYFCGEYPNQQIVRVLKR